MVWSEKGIVGQKVESRNMRPGLSGFWMKPTVRCFSELLHALPAVCGRIKPRWKSLIGGQNTTTCCLSVLYTTLDYLEKFVSK